MIIDTPTRYSDGVVDLRCGDWREVLADVGEFDAVITDPPYSERVLIGYRSGSDVDQSGRRGVFNITYAAWTEAECAEFVADVVSRTRHFAVVFNDHIGARWLEAAFDDAGWYVFQPLPWVRTNPPPRFAGDGPASATEWIVVARPRGLPKGERAGSRPGAYVCAAENSQTQAIVGQKPISLMRRIIREYTLRGDVVADHFGGASTSLLAAKIEGRRAIGAELDPKTFALAADRLRGLGPMRKEQGNLFERAL